MSPYSEDRAVSAPRFVGVAQNYQVDVDVHPHEPNKPREIERTNAEIARPCVRLLSGFDPAITGELSEEQVDPPSGIGPSRTGRVSPSQLSRSESGWWARLTEVVPREPELVVVLDPSWLKRTEGTRRCLRNTSPDIAGISR